MGKIRRVRTKMHIEAVKSDAGKLSNAADFTPNQSDLPAVFPINNLFQSDAEKTKHDQITSTNEDGEDPQVNKGKVISKKDKRKMRHEKFLKKLHACQEVKNKLKAAKKRQKTVIIGDLNPLTQALQDINMLPTAKEDKRKRKNKKRKSSSNDRKRLNSQISDLETFRQVIAHPAFKSNPLQTIDEHVRNVIGRETKNQ